MRETDTLTAQISAEGQSLPAAAPASANPKHVKTRGEQHFDWVTYRNWGYYTNVGLSLLAVYWVERMQSGQKFMASLVRGMESLGVPNKNGWASYLAGKTFFLTGGFAVIPPMKWLEDRKVELVKKYNRELYYGAKADTDPVVIQSEKELEAAPKQNWSSVISSRLLALIPFYFAYSVLWDHKSFLAKNTGFYVDKPIVWVSRKLGKLSASVFGDQKALAHISHLEKTSPKELLSVWKPGADPMHSTGPYYFISEAITSAIVAVGIYILTRVLAPIIGTKQTTAMPAAQAPIQLSPVAASAQVAEAPRRVDRPDTQVRQVSAQQRVVATQEREVAG